MNDKLLEVSMMLGDAIKKLDNLSAYKPDPYAELKEAQERGEVIQVLEDSPKEMWLDLVEPEYYHEPEFYRIKPKEKKKLADVETVNAYSKENGSAWTGKVDGKDISFVARGGTGVDIFNCALDEDEVEQYLDPYRFNYGEKKKLYLWAYQDKVTKSWKLTDRYMESAEDVEQDYRWIDDFQRIDSSMIEVDA